jgi:P22 coat protein - gene protein 5
MANTLATPTWVTKEVARGFVNKVVFLSNVNRTYDDQYKINGAKVGNTVNARLPQRFTVTDGQALQLQALYDQTVPITLTNQKNVAFGYSSAQATTELDNIRERYTQPGAEALGNAADVLAFQAVYRDVYSAVGVPGTTPSANLTYLQAGVKLTDLGAPTSGRKAVLDPMAMVTIANANLTSFNPASAITEAFREGLFGRNALAVDEWYQDPNRPVHTTGSWTATASPAVNGANQTGSTLATSGWASGSTALKKGDVFTIAGVYGVNPLSYQSTGRLQQFVITADATDTAGAIAALPISPSIITSGQLQTVTNSPANGAVIRLLGQSADTSATYAATASPQSLLFHPDAFAFVMADLIRPSAGATSTTARSRQAGIAIRMVEQYQIGTDQNPSRLDILIGAATLQARLAVRVWG